MVVVGGKDRIEVATYQETSLEKIGGFFLKR
jgi:hypothetical protein